MTWLTWRQHRKQFLFAIIGLAVLAAVLVPTGRSQYRAFDGSGLAACLRTMGETIDYRLADTDCHEPLERFSAEYSGDFAPAVLLIFLPLLVGLFFGAPLVAREVERGTHRLVWTQGTTRLRWAVTKFGLVGAGALLLAAAYAALASWWLYPIAVAHAGRFDYLAFDVQGIAPVGYTVFTLALGTFAGTVWQKVLPAMALTLVGFVGARVAVELARPNFLPPVERRFPVVAYTFPNPMLSDWILDRNVYDASGQVIVPGGDVFCDPPCPEYDPAAYNVHLYQPAGRFWLFQFIEAGLFVVLAATLLALAVYRVRRRIA